MVATDDHYTEAVLYFVNWQSFGHLPDIYDMPCDTAREFFSVCAMAKDLGIRVAPPGAR